MAVAGTVAVGAGMAGMVTAIMRTMTTEKIFGCTSNRWKILPSGRQVANTAGLFSFHRRA
jgi:hypothetical protein